MELPKDIYEYLTNFADDKDILNMLSVNNKFRDDEFFRRVMRRKYPSLIEYKEENETWKLFFIKTAYYIAKLKEVYGIPYISRCDPKKLLAFGGHKYPNKIYEEAMICAAGVGDLENVKLMVEKGFQIGWKSINNSVLEPLKWASYFGYLNIVKYLIEMVENIGVPTKGIYNVTLNNAAFGGQIEIVKYALEKGAITINPAMRFAAFGGRLDIVKLLIENGADDFNEALNYAVKKKNNIEVIKFLIENGAKNIDESMIVAAENGRLTAVKFLISKGIKNIDQAAINAAKNGHLNVVNYLISQGAKNPNY